MNSFVNPYTFAPIADPLREAPGGHLPTADALVGSIDVTVTLKTPLLVTQDGRAALMDSNGLLHIPGSSLKGAVRSLHEAAFHGCMRVLDTDFVPGYRSPVEVDPGWTLAVIVKDVAGIPTHIQLCVEKETLWVDATSLAEAYRRAGQRRLPTTGDIVSVYGDIEDTTLDRYEMSVVSEVEVHPEPRPLSAQGEPQPLGPDGAQVFLVTHTGARKTTKRSGAAARCLWASSVLGHDVLEFDANGADGDCYRAFRAAAAGADDRRRLEKQDDTSWRVRTARDKVQWQGRDVAVRAQQSGLLFRGDVVWVRLSASDGTQRVGAIKLAAAWRHSGQGPVHERIGAAHPCLTNDDKDDHLCLSCETFGAAEASDGRRTSSTGPAQQRSYAGHVRFGSLTSDEPVTLCDEFDLAPLGSPKPSSGGFYLQMSRQVSPAADRNEVASHWGSHTDRRGTSPINGRKFYWHSDPDKQRDHWRHVVGQSNLIPRYEATTEQVTRPDNTERGTRRRAQLVPAGTVLRGTVAIDGLTSAQTHAVLASLDPRRLLPEGDGRRLATHLGGGKPHGLGSVTVDVAPHLHRVRERYTTPHPRELDFGTRMDARVWSELTRRTGADAQSVSVLLHILDQDALGDDANLVSYPPSAPWSRFGTQIFRLSYAFFQGANGQTLKTRTNPWHPLPGPHRDPKMPIIQGRSR